MRRGPTRGLSVPFASACNALGHVPTVGGVARPTANLLAVAPAGVYLELRPLCSAGITRLPSLVRASPSPHTAWPAPHGGPVDGHAPPPRGLPVLRRISSCPHAVVNTPAGPREGVARHVAWWQPSPFSRRVGPCVACFEACSTFTARYGLLARGVAERPFPPKASTVSLPPRSLRLLPVGATSCRVGVAPTEDPRLCTAHVKTIRVGAATQKSAGGTAAVSPRRSGGHGRRPMVSTRLIMPSGLRPRKTRTSRAIRPRKTPAPTAANTNIPRTSRPQPLASLAASVTRKHPRAVKRNSPAQRRTLTGSRVRLYGGWLAWQRFSARA